MKKKTFYHVTLKQNVEDILKEGVDPEMARGRWRASWWVTADRLDWAMAHVSLKHDTPVSNLSIFSAGFPATEWDKTMIRTSWSGVFRCKVTITPDDLMSAETYFVWNNPDVEVKE